MKYFAIFILLITFSNCTYADGNKFLPECKVMTDILDNKPTNGSISTATSCMSMIDGFRHMNSFYEKHLPQEQILFCIPQKVQAGQLLRVVVKYMEDNPSQLHSHEAVLIFLALSNVFPCDK